MTQVIDIEYLRTCFDYDQETGVVSWKARPREHFPDERAWKIFNTRYADQGCRRKSFGYLKCSLYYEGAKRELFAHRIAWALTTGAWPKADIDHRNGVRDDNRLSNLREATRTENHQNRARRRDNTTGYVGVCFDRGKFAANIMLHNRSKHLGRYGTKEEAYAAYCAAKRERHPFQPEAVER